MYHRNKIVSPILIGIDIYLSEYMYSEYSTFVFVSFHSRCFAVVVVKGLVEESYYSVYYPKKVHWLHCAIVLAILITSGYTL